MQGTGPNVAQQPSGALQLIPVLNMKVVSLASRSARVYWASLGFRCVQLTPKSFVFIYIL